MYTSGLTGLGAGFLAVQVAPAWLGGSNYVTGPVIAFVAYALAFGLARRKSQPQSLPG